MKTKLALLWIGWLFLLPPAVGAAEATAVNPPGWLGGTLAVLALALAAGTVVLWRRR